jgi:hypothetical protein
MWTCSTCGRSFRNTNQQHTCQLIDKEDLFAKRPPQLKILYEKVSDYAKTLGSFREETVLPDVIFFKTKSTFLAVKVKKDHLDIEFFLDHLEENPPVAKWLQTSKHRVAHIVPIDERADLNAQLKRWIKQSFELIEGA